jgi:hypothetical protein
MKPGRRAVRVRSMNATAKTPQAPHRASQAPHEISFRLNDGSARTAIPLTLWTDFVVAGERVYIRTRRPVPLLRELCGSALDNGTELPGIEVRSLAEGEEP